MLNDSLLYSRDVIVGNVLNDGLLYSRDVIVGSVSADVNQANIIEVTNTRARARWT